MTKYIVGIMIALTFNGCIVGDVVALPFRITGAVVDVESGTLTVKLV